MSSQTRRCRCPRCGSVFFTNIGNKVYCQVDCQKSAQNARYYARKKAAK